MRDKNQKKLQKKINKIVKDLNQNIYNDSLWLARFYAHQTQADYSKFPDGSGGILSARIELVDRKTNQTKSVRIETCGGLDRFLAFDLFKAMNDFIVEDCDVWTKDDPYHNTIDFRKEADKKC